MCIFRDTALIFSFYFPFDLNIVQVNENGLSKDPSVKEKKYSKTKRIIINGYYNFRVEKYKMVRKLL